jgi:hypothetical protein
METEAMTHKREYTRICPSAANGDFGRFQELYGAFEVLESLGTALL